MEWNQLYQLWNRRGQLLFVGRRPFPRNHACTGRYECQPYTCRRADQDLQQQFDSTFRACLSQQQSFWQSSCFEKRADGHVFLAGLGGRLVNEQPTPSAYKLPAEFLEKQKLGKLKVGR